jgi:ABC-type lipoprotein release transport system permease subunit
MSSMPFIYTGLLTGYLKGMEDMILDIETGDAQVYAEGYREKPSLYTTIEHPDAFADELEALGFTVSARLLATGLGAGEDNSAGVQLIGIDVVDDAKVTAVSEHVRDGTWLAPADEGVVLGHRLAQNLGLDVGDELVVLTQGADGSMANEIYPVRGVLKGISEGIDRAGVFMTQARFRELLVLPDGVHQMILRAPEGVDLEAATEEANDLAPEGVEVKRWDQLLPMLASMLQSASGAVKIMSIVIYLAVGVLILNAMLMAVFERIRELGVLKAIGMSPDRIFALIMAETGIQTGAAIVVGVSLAIPVNWYLSTTGLDLSALGNMTIMGVASDPIWRSEVHLDTYTGPTIILVVIVFIAVLYPAIHAARIRPLDAIHD